MLVWRNKSSCTQADKTSSHFVSISSAFRTVFTPYLRLSATVVQSVVPEPDRNDFVRFICSDTEVSSTSFVASFISYQATFPSFL